MVLLDLVVLLLQFSHLLVQFLDLVDLVLLHTRVPALLAEAGRVFLQVALLVLVEGQFLDFQPQLALDVFGQVL